MVWRRHDDVAGAGCRRREALGGTPPEWCRYGEEVDASEQAHRPEDLSAEERRQLHRSHQRLRNASQALEALVATEPIRGRWNPEPATPEALDGARAELRRAYEGLARCHHELLGWDAPPGPVA